MARGISIIRRLLNRLSAWVKAVGIIAILALIIAAFQLLPRTTLDRIFCGVGNADACTPTPVPSITPPPTPRPQSTPIPTASLVPIPSISLYDDFNDANINTTKWIKSLYGTTLTYNLNQTNGALVFDQPKPFNNGGWDDLIINRSSKIQEIQALITFETNSDYGFGISARLANAKNTRYDFMLSSSGFYYFYDGTTIIDQGSLEGHCCPITHLIGFRADGIQWSFYVDGILKASVSIEQNPIGSEYGVGFQFNVGRNQIAKVSISKVWVQLEN